jgi:hypothetical protein
MFEKALRINRMMPSNERQAKGKRDKSKATYNAYSLKNGKKTSIAANFWMWVFLENA